MLYFKRIFLAVILLIAAQAPTYSLSRYAEDRCNTWVDSVLESMTVDEKIGQLFVYNTPAQNTKANRATLVKVINNYHVGGLLFWKGCILGQANLTNLAQETTKIPLFITLDGEWGLSMRLKDAMRFPRKMTLSAIKDEQLIYDLGAEIGRQCNLMGINIDFDPVLDVNLNPQNPVINTRSFGDNQQEVARKAELFINGLRSKNVMAVCKHFPGHGDTQQDSHAEIAIVTHSKAQLDSVDLYPYRYLMQNNNLDAVMVGHLSVPSIDTTHTPASLSKIAVDSLLIKRMQFKGLIFTDAMKMKAVSDIADSPVKALLAGVDIILDPENISKAYGQVKKAVEDGRINQDLLDQKCKKILQYKYLWGLSKTEPIDTTALIDQLNSPEAELLQQRIANNSATAFKDDKHLLPIKDLTKKIAVVSVYGDEYPTVFIDVASRYCDFSKYKLNKNTTESEWGTIDSALIKADIVILAIATNEVSDTVISNLCHGKKNVIQAYLINPYNTSKYPLSINAASTCILGYELTPYMQSTLAQSIFGGIKTSGTLPVQLKTIGYRGKGFEIEKTRLGYGVPESVEMSSSSLSYIDDIVKEGLEKEAYPGCQVVVVRKGVVVYDKAFGYHDYSKSLPVIPSDVYDLASVTKVAATLPMLMKLCDDHKIAPEDNVQRYLPNFTKLAKNLTLQDLMMHQSGLPASVPLYQQAIDKSCFNGTSMFQAKRDSLHNVQVDNNLYGYSDFKFKEGYITKTSDSKHLIPVADSMFVLNSFPDTMFNCIADVTPKAQRKYKYSDLNFILLKKIGEIAAKESMPNYLEENFYYKLGANSMGFWPYRKMNLNRIVPTATDSFLRKQTLCGYVHDQNAAFMGGCAGHAGLFASANDMAKLYQMILNEGEYGGERYLSEAMCKKFLTAKSNISKRGLGFNRMDVTAEEILANGRHTQVRHTMLGHYGFSGTCVWLDPKEDLIYIFLSNRICPDAWENTLMKLNIRSRIAEAIYRSIDHRAEANKKK